MPILRVLQHVPHEGPGAIARWNAARNGETRITRLDLGETPPDEESDVDLLVILGGPMNIYEDAHFPWLAMERAYISRQIHSGRKILGVCLGSQLLADALGSRVRPHDCKEVGWYPVRFSEAAREQHPCIPEALSVLHWHGDTFDVPQHATELGRSEACACQGFLWQDQIVALQFHMETGLEEVDDFCRWNAEDLAPGKYVQTAEAIREGRLEHVSSNLKVLNALLDRWLHRNG